MTRLYEENEKGRISTFLNKFLMIGVMFIYQFGVTNSRIKHVRRNVHLLTISNKILTKLVNTYAYSYYFLYVVIISILNLSLLNCNLNNNIKALGTGILPLLTCCRANFFIKIKTELSNHQNCGFLLAIVVMIII